MHPQDMLVHIVPIVNTSIQGLTICKGKISHILPQSRILTHVRHVKAHHPEKEKDDPVLRSVLARRPEGGTRGRRRRIGVSSQNADFADLRH
jgi:hypothetical protein